MKNQTKKPLGLCFRTIVCITSLYNICCCLSTIRIIARNSGAGILIEESYCYNRYRKLFSRNKYKWCARKIRLKFPPLMIAKIADSTIANRQYFSSWIFIRRYHGAYVPHMLTISRRRSEAPRLKW